jgi:APA family basic amino acid/polyamine antiporter
LPAGLLAFAGAMAYAELATLRPKAGGEYVYLRDALGRLAAFLSGWTSFVAGFAGAIATSAVVISFYLGRFIPAAGDGTPFFTLPLIPGVITLSVSRQSIVALTAIWGLAWVHRPRRRAGACGWQRAGRPEGRCPCRLRGAGVVRGRR